MTARTQTSTWIGFVNRFQHSPAGELPAGAGPNGALGGDGKERLLIAFAEYYGCRTLVETGLWNGRGSGMRVFESGAVDYYVAIDWQGDNIDAVLDRYHGRDDYSAIIGDSGRILGGLPAWTAPAPFLFWLDAHALDASEGAPPCPLRAELEAIIGWQHAGSSVVLIDDLHMMGTFDWPQLDDVRRLVDDADLWDRAEDANIIRLTPKGDLR